MIDTVRTVMAPWRAPGRLLRAGGHVTLALPIGIAGATIAYTGVGVSAAAVPVALLGLPLFVATLWAVHGFASMERSRAAAYGRVPIADPVRPLRAAGRIARVRERATSPARWREVAYAGLIVVPATVAFALVISVWSASLGLLALPVAIHAYPDQVAHFHLVDVSGWAVWIVGAVGLAGVVLLAPWLTIGTANGLLLLAQRLLGPSDTDLAQRLTEAETSRDAAVLAAEAERRRIERDLHDGAQQRLVALAADLGAARQSIAHDPAGAAVLVARAHEEAKGALREIRDLVRGIHPVILQDRGLDAALSAVVARSPVAVALDITPSINQPSPLPVAVESAAYFVVAEAITNVTRHARASKASVAIARAGDRLVIEVRDDGVGGADASAGTGLQGLRDRVTSLHGSMLVISPPGGPTTVSVELPCGS